MGRIHLSSGLAKAYTMKLGNEGKITIGHRKLQNIVVTTISTALPFAFGAVLVMAGRGAGARGMEVKKSREYLFVLLWHLLKRNLSSSFGRTSDDRDIEAKKYTGVSSKSAIILI